MDMYTEWLHANCQTYPWWETAADIYGIENLMLKQLELFRRCLQAGNRDLVMQFENRYYLQKRGLAMGVADSPDLANLFGAFFENKSGILTDPSVLFYGRYIDDCLAIVLAETASEACAKMDSYIQYDECKILWEASDLGQPFLDMYLYIDTDNTLQYMPYRKALNHMERIPWISNHPIDVKKGTFTGEMSRLATISSKLEHYLDAMRGLVSLYVQRGYPETVCLKWYNQYAKVRWENRLITAERSSAEVLVLKTSFNTAWNYFSASELGDTVISYWREALERYSRMEPNMEFPSLDYTKEDFSGDFVGVGSTTFTDLNGDEVSVPDVSKIGIFNRRWITSRKRTRNLFDLTNLWKKTVLETLDARVLDHQFIDLELDEPLLPTTHQLDAEGKIVKRLRRSDGRFDITCMDDDDEIVLHHRAPSPSTMSEFMMEEGEIDPSSSSLVFGSKSQPWA
jgi:hypothetical protein